MPDSDILDRDGNKISEEEAYAYVQEFKLSLYEWAIETDVDIRVMIVGLCEMLPLMLLSNLEATQAHDTAKAMVEFIDEHIDNPEMMTELMTATTAGTA